MFLEWIALRCLLTVVNLLFLGWLTLSSLLTVVNLMLCFRLGDIKSATVSSQLTKMKTAKMKKMQVVNLLFLPFNYVCNKISRYVHLFFENRHSLC